MQFDSSNDMANNGVSDLKNINNLVWIDMEMSGLDVNCEVILEVAMVITDGDLNVLVSSDSYAVYQPKSILDNMDAWNKSTHGKSGLIDKVLSSSSSIADIENELLNMLKPYVYEGKAPLCGNTVHQDRKFMSKYMPALEAYLHYRNLDVSSVREIARRWYPAVLDMQKGNKHEALADIHESICELKYYRNLIFK